MIHTACFGKHAHTYSTHNSRMNYKVGGARWYTVTDGKKKSYLIIINLSKKRYSSCFTFSMASNILLNDVILTRNPKLSIVRKHFVSTTLHAVRRWAGILQFTSASDLQWPSLTRHRPTVPSLNVVIRREEEGVMVSLPDRTPKQFHFLM